MILRLSIKTLDSGTPVDLLNYDNANINCNLDINGEQFFSTVDLINALGVPLTVNLVNGFTATISLESLYILKVKIDHPYTGAEPRVWDNCNLTVDISKTDYNSFLETFKIYNYDLGNNPLVNNPAGNPIDYNYDFSIFLINASANDNYPYLIAYRAPFSDLVHVYKATTTIGTVNYYDTNNTLLSSLEDFIICSEEEFTVKQSITISNVVVTGSLSTLPPQDYKPEFDFTVSTTNSDTINNISDNVATPSIDYDTIDTVFIDDIERYPFQNQQLIYNLYDYAGTLVSSFVDNYQLGAYNTFIFDGTAHAWDSFNTPLVGDYVIKLTLCIVGLDSGTELDNTTTALQIDRWYRIIDNTGADFTTCGSANNLIGTDFAYDNNPFTFGDGIIHPLTNIIECYKSKPINSGNWFEIVQKDCSTYTVHNHSFNDVVISIYQLSDDKSFEVMTDYQNITIASLDSYTITFDTDNIYKIDQSITNGDDTVVSYLIYHYCNLKTCLLTYINNLICQTNPCCTDYCKDFYNFHSIIINAHTYFNMLNTEYNLGYVFNSISSTKLDELYTTKQLLDKIVGYCETDPCVKTSSSSSSSSDSDCIGCGS